MTGRLPLVGERVRVTVPVWIHVRGGERLFVGRVDRTDPHSRVFTIRTHDIRFHADFVDVEVIGSRRAQTVAERLTMAARRVMTGEPADTIVVLLGDDRATTVDRLGDWSHESYAPRPANTHENRRNR